MYTEPGYLTNVKCIYNTTSNFTLSEVGEWLYAAAGTLPDSVQGPEYSNYIGHNSEAIVAIGVSYSQLSPRRYLAITAGQHYANLNNTQCEFDFQPWTFRVNVDLRNLNISVTPLRSLSLRSFDEDRNISRTVVRQFELLSNDLTNLYDSLLGQALNSSIAAYTMATWDTRPPLTPEARTLGGLTNSITAMADDMLLAYGTAQLMVGTRLAPEFSTAHDVTARVAVFGLQFGQPLYIYAVFALNAVILVALFCESVRTDSWRKLTRFDYLDPRDLIVAASRGGVQLANAADEISRRRGQRAPRHLWGLSDPDEGNGRLVVRLKEDENGQAAIELDEERNGEGWVNYNKNMDVDEEKALAKEAWERKMKGKVGVGVGVFGAVR